jgi:hypothetical protein
MNMTPEQKIKSAILMRAVEAGDTLIGEPITVENVDDLYDENNDDYQLQDYVSEMRQGEIETTIPHEYSRHYEAKSVAAQASDGSWVGWTYWYGGGKHGEPEEIDWMDSAYELDCVEEEKMVIVRTFAKKQEMK